MNAHKNPLFLTQNPQPYLSDAGSRKSGAHKLGIAQISLIEPLKLQKRKPNGCAVIPQTGVGNFAQGSVSN
jgi:hypothetical protein